MTKYVITDGNNRWIMNHNGRYVPTSCYAFSEEFTERQAKMVCQNQLTKPLRKLFYPEKLETNVISGTKPCTKKDIQETEKVLMSPNVQKWLNKVSDLNGLAKEAQSRKDELNNELSQIDQELSDVNHYIEFCNLNAAQGYKAYKMIKERRIKRRTIKNELNVLNIILGKKISETATDEIEKAVTRMDKRTYEPRIMEELFDF